MRQQESPDLAIGAPPPSVRRLRAFTFDPAAAADPQTALINEAVLKVPWERLEPGPVGEYLEVVDRDPASDACYRPVDLDHPDLLAQDGLPSSEGNPQFHQQMVYAVAMTTIRNFERAIGRRVLWSPRRVYDEKGKPRDEFVRRLRIYPHALREANAYYSPEKKALLFGYFRASEEDSGRNLPGGLVFTCLSHDIVAHETTHAILDGLHRRFVEPSNADTLAFHEAFADIVAIFQHFTFPEAVRHQIGKTRGDLSRENLLAALASQFGEAIGLRSALRSAIGKPEVKLGDEVQEPHDRGAILVAAVFDAFLMIYRDRIADLLRLVTGSGGRFPQDDLHPDLRERLVGEATKVAGQVLAMCVRALDYCPPVDLTFGAYLRALVTADFDHVPLDERGYRLAFVEAFRRRGIYPVECRSLSVENLLWCPPRDLKSFPVAPDLELRPTVDREDSYRRSETNAYRVWTWLTGKSGPRGDALEELGLTVDPGAPQTIRRSGRTGLPAVEVHSVRVARRIDQDNEVHSDIVVELTQRRRGYLDPGQQARADEMPWDKQPPEDFWFRGGCTLLVNAAVERADHAGENRVRYAVAESILSKPRLERHRAYLRSLLRQGLAAAYFGASPWRTGGEPFALLHRHVQEADQWRR
jgi:hypothetical protein